MIDLAVKAFEILKVKNQENNNKEPECVLNDIVIYGAYTGSCKARGQEFSPFALTGRWLDIYQNNARVFICENGRVTRSIVGEKSSWVEKIKEAGHKAILQSLLGP